MPQLYMWRVINFETSEIIESNSLGVIIRTCIEDVERGHNVRLYHIDTPNTPIDINTYLQAHKRILAKIKLYAKCRDITELKYWVNRYRQQYS